MKFRQKLTAICFSLASIQPLYTGPLDEIADNAPLEGELASSTELVGWSLFHSEDEDKYIINFNNVSIGEYLRFVSKISGVNFQFNQEEMDFTITVVSEEPLTVQNILSALIQTLRAKGFYLLEQDNTLLITTSPDIKQIPKIVTSDEKAKKLEAPIITKVFAINKANINSLAAIIRPMLSKSAMLDVSADTRQLIVTDITTNVEKIATLIKALDISHTSLEMEAYKVRHSSAESLIDMTKKLMAPFVEQNPFILVPQKESNTVFIVSTPYLIDKALDVMEDVDAKPRTTEEGKLSVGDGVFLYPIANKSPDELLDAIDEIAEELVDSGSQSIQLISALENAKYIKDSNSILFMTDPATKLQIEEIMKTLDTQTDARNYFIYKIQQAGKEQIERSLDHLARSLKKSDSNRDLIDAIYSLRYIKETNSIVFTGQEEALKKLKELLPMFDSAVAKSSPSSHFWLYTPQYLNGKELEKAFDDVEKNLKSAGLADPELLMAIGSMKWVPTTNTLLFTGTPQSLDQIQSITKLIDVPSGSPSKIFIYKPKFISNEQIEDALDELADKLDPKNLSDKNLAQAIDNVTWITETRSFLFKADPGTIDKIEKFLKDIDNAKEAEAVSNAYYLYKLKHAQGEDVVDYLEKIANSLPQADPQERSIATTIDNLTLLRDTNAILLTGEQQAVDEVKMLINQFDAPEATPTSFEKTSFYIYKPKHLTPSELEEALKETASDLKKSGLVDQTLLASIDTMRVVDITNSVIFTGTKESLKKTEEIIDIIDVPGEQALLKEYGGDNFFIYKVRYVPLPKLLNQLQNVAQNLQREGSEQSRTMARVLKGAKEVKETNSLLFTGPPPILEKIAELLKQLDVPGGVAEGEEPQAPGSYVIYKPVNVSGPELIEMLKDFERNLQATGVKEPKLFEAIHQLKFIQRTGYILISGGSKAVEKIEELLKKFDVPGNEGAVTSLNQLETSFLVYKLQYHQGSELQQTLKTVGNDLSASEPQTSSRLLKAINSIQWIKMTNSLLATGPPDVLTQLKELIQNLDIPLRQVFIEVLIIRTTITNNQQFGLQWGSKFQYLNRFAGGVSNFPAPNVSTGTSNALLAPGLSAVNGTRTPIANLIPNPGLSTGTETTFPGGFDLGVIGDIILHRGRTFISLASLVNALQADEDSVIVMNPKIIAQDNQQSTIFVGQNIPFTGSNVTNQSANSVIQSNIEYRDVGTNLTITPILGSGDTITLDISNEITSQVANTTGVGADLQGLQTSRTSLNTRVHVPNKHFLALSGMISDTKSHFRSGIPCLGGLPVIGAIFAENDRTNARDNLIYFIRPVIIDSVEEYEKITENQEDLYRDLGSKQVIKEEIDDAIDWVRYPACD